MYSDRVDNVTRATNPSLLLLRMPSSSHPFSSHLSVSVYTVRSSHLSRFFSYLPWMQRCVKHAQSSPTLSYSLLRQTFCCYFLFFLLFVFHFIFLLYMYSFFSEWLVCIFTRHLNSLQRKKLSNH